MQMLDVRRAWKVAYLVVDTTWRGDLERQWTMFTVSCEPDVNNGMAGV